MNSPRPFAIDHAALLDEIDELVCVTDVAGRIEYVNRAWQHALGYTLAETGVRAPIEYVAAECRTAYRDIERQVMRGTRVDAFEAVLIARDGSRIVTQARARPVFAAAGDVPGSSPVLAGVYSVYRDVTAKRRSDAMRDRLVATIEASPDYVAVATRDGALVFVNRAGRELIGVDGGVDGAVRVAGMYPPDEAERLAREIMPEVLAAGRWSGESALVDAHGARIPVALMLVAHPSTRADDPAAYFVSMLARDLRPERAGVAALRASEARYRSVVSALDEGVIVTEADGAGGGVIVACNPSAEAISGFSPGTLCGARDFWSQWADVCDADGQPFAADALPTPRTLRTGVPASGVTFGVRRRDGMLRWIRASSRGLFPETGHEGGQGGGHEGVDSGALPYAVVTTFSDVTAEREAAEEIERLATAVSMSLDGLSVSRTNGALVYTNPAHDRLYGYEPGELIGRTWHALYEPEEVERLGPSIFGALTTAGLWVGEAVGRRKDGTNYPQELRMRQLPWGGVVTVVRDISERKAHEAVLHELSQRDELTGLFNRRGFFAHAERTLVQAARAHTPQLLLYGDLDRFKAINDTRGHAAGDAALRTVARALREVFRPADVLGRLGGDEFVVVAEGGAERVAALRGRLADALARAAAHDTTALGGAEVGMSIGVAAFRPEVPAIGGGQLVTALLKEADAQLYAAKAARREARAA